MKSRSGLIVAPFVFVPVFALTVAGMSTRDAGLHTPAHVACTATFSPDSVPIQQEPVMVNYMVPDSIAAITSATAPQESMLKVESVDSENRTLNLNTANAMEGAWTLQLVAGEQTTCTGELKVHRPPRGR